MNSSVKIIEGSRYSSNKFSIQGINGWIFFSIICVVYILQTYVSNTYFFTDQFYYRSFSDQLTFQTVDTFLNMQKEYGWVGYVFTPLIIALKIFSAALCISIGAVLSNIEFKFRTIFKAALLAEVVFILGQIIYLINVSFHLDTLTLETASNYYPLTILSYFGTQNVVDWLQYPLQTLNLFEVFYMAAIAWLLAKQWKQDFIESLVVVLPSYVTGLVLWLALVTFLTLQVS